METSALGGRGRARARATLDAKIYSPIKLERKSPARPRFLFLRTWFMGINRLREERQSGVCMVYPARKIADFRLSTGVICKIVCPFTLAKFGIAWRENRAFEVKRRGRERMKH